MFAVIMCNIIIGTAKKFCIGHINATYRTLFKILCKCSKFYQGGLNYDFLTKSSVITK